MQHHSRQNPNPADGTHGLSFAILKPLYRYLIAFFLLKRFVFYPLGRLILIYASAPAQTYYIARTDRSIFFRSPSLILAAITMVLCCCLLTWCEIAGAILCMQHISLGKTPRVIELISDAFRSIRCPLKPQNLPVFLYLLLISPFTWLYFIARAAIQKDVPALLNRPTILIALSLMTALMIAVLLTLLTLPCIQVIPGMVLGDLGFMSAFRSSLRTSPLTDLLGFVCREMIHLALFPGSLCLIAAKTTARLLIPETVITRYTMNLFLFHILPELLIAITGIYLLGSIVTFVCTEDKPSSLLRSLLTTASVTVLIFCLFGGSTVYLNTHPAAAAHITAEKPLISHRGDTLKAPENTLDSFRAAADSGRASMLELDVRLSRDGIPIVIHNESLRAAAGIAESVYDLDYEEIHSYPAHFRWPQKQFPNTHISSLEDVLMEFGDRIPILIEIKQDERAPELPGKVAQLMQRYHCTSTCLVQSGSYGALRQVKAVDPDIDCGLVILFGADAFALLPGIDFLTTNHSSITEELCLLLHAMGKELYAWTINDESTLRKLQKLSVDALITNRLDLT